MQGLITSKLFSSTLAFRQCGAENIIFHVFCFQRLLHSFQLLRL